MNTPIAATSSEAGRTIAQLGVRRIGLQGGTLSPAARRLERSLPDRAEDARRLG